jgi:uncharacterized cupin superfamily protein
VNDSNRDSPVAPVPAEDSLAAFYSEQELTGIVTPAFDTPSAVGPRDAIAEFTAEHADGRFSVALPRRPRKRTQSAVVASAAMFALAIPIAAFLLRPAPSAQADPGPRPNSAAASFRPPSAPVSSGPASLAMAGIVTTKSPSPSAAPVVQHHRAAGAMPTATFERRWTLDRSPPLPVWLHATSMALFTELPTAAPNDATAAYTTLVASPVADDALSPTPATGGRRVTVTADASDPDGDTLTYRWSAPTGTFANASERQTVFTCPAISGSVTVTVDVTDSKGGSASDTMTVPCGRSGH